VNERETIQSTEDALIGEILADARKKAERLARRADQEAKGVLNKARHEADALAAAAIAAAQARAGREKTVVLATVDIEAQRLDIDAHERIIREAFDTAGKRLADKRSYDYAGTLVKLIAAAAKTIGGDSFTVALSQDDARQADARDLQQKVSAALGRAVTLQLDQPAPITGGAIVRSADGHRLVDNSLEARMRRMREQLRRQVAQELFK